MAHPSRQAYGEVFRTFFKLGLTSFGGPVAHLGYLQTECVERRRWLDESAFSERVALSQFLPGPASSQVVFALGFLRAGWIGGLLASLGFTLPSAVLMILFAYGVASFGDLDNAGWLRGLKLAAVAVVAQAVWAMGRKLCPDRTRLSIAGVTASILLIHPGTPTQMIVIAAGAAAGAWFYRGKPNERTLGFPFRWKAHTGAATMLICFFVLLALLPILASTSRLQSIAVLDSFYRSGALVFGGGHVILPLLRAEVVPPGWVTDDVFLAGYGAAQALPGPLFTFAGYLGAAIQGGNAAWIAGIGCLIAIFLPALLLIAGALPFWEQLRAQRWTNAALCGTNAAVVGLLLATLYQPMMVESIRSHADMATAVLAFTLLHWCKLPPWLLVGLCAVVGQWWLP